VIVRVAFILSLIAFVGCTRRENIPNYPRMSVSDSLKVIEARSAIIKDISGEGAITLTDPKGQSVRLEAAFVFAPPGRARIRAWKFGQAVLDLTITPDSIYIFVPQKKGPGEQLRTTLGDTGAAVRQWLSLLAPVFSGSFDVAESGSQLIVTHRSFFVIYIDRKTLTPRRYVARDDDGCNRFILTLDRYRTIGGTVWPMRIEAKSSTGTIRIDPRDVELNVAPPNAFKPPARAGQLP
jgi:outer membrane lipoprotein-sorting protein